MQICNYKPRKVESDWKLASVEIVEIVETADFGVLVGLDCSEELESYITKIQRFTSLTRNDYYTYTFSALLSTVFGGVIGIVAPLSTTKRLCMRYLE